MNILIISAYKKYTSSRAFISPLIFWEESLRKKNIFISIKDNFRFVTYNDIIVIDSKFLKIYNYDIDKFKREVSNLKHKCNKLILSENTDSCAWLLGDLIDYFDFVWKGQLYKDKSNYKRKHYGGRFFTNQINDMHNIKDRNLLYNFVLNDSQIKKLKISWNSGLLRHIDYRFLWKYKVYHNKFIRGNFKKVDFSSSKDLDISARINTNYDRNTVRFIRESAQKYLEIYTDTTKINLSEYFKELYRSKICVSPFGWGEICYRDFECFESKCILIKNNMSDLETWPDYYQENITYLPIKIDSRDLVSKLQEVIDNYDRYLYIAENGYKKFKQCIDTKFGNKFSSKIKKLFDIYESN